MTAKMMNTQAAVAKLQTKKPDGLASERELKT
jgi:hypothetical protein